jgi:spore coat protein CotH
LYEYRWRNAYNLSDLGNDLDSYATRFEPRNHLTESRSSLFSPVRELVRAINDAPAANLEAALAPYLEIRPVLTQVAIENFLSEWDGLVGNWGVDNFYLYRTTQNMWRIIPWDKDNTFTWLETPPSQRMDENVLTRKAWGVPQLRRYYLDRLNSVATIADGWLEQEILRTYAQIRAAALQDTFKPVSNSEFEKAVADILEFARQRPAIVRRFIAQL